MHQVGCGVQFQYKFLQCQVQVRDFYYKNPCFLHLFSHFCFWTELKVLEWTLNTCLLSASIVVGENLCSSRCSVIELYDFVYCIRRLHWLIGRCWACCWQNTYPNDGPKAARSAGSIPGGRSNPLSLCPQLPISVLAQRVKVEQWLGVDLHTFENVSFATVLVRVTSGFHSKICQFL